MKCGLPSLHATEDRLGPSCGLAATTVGRLCSSQSREHPTESASVGRRLELAAGEGRERTVERGATQEGTAASAASFRRSCRARTVSTRRRAAACRPAWSRAAGLLVRCEVRRRRRPLAPGGTGRIVATDLCAELSDVRLLHGPCTKPRVRRPHGRYWGHSGQRHRRWTDGGPGSGPTAIGDTMTDLHHPDLRVGHRATGSVQR